MLVARPNLQSFSAAPLLTGTATRNLAHAPRQQPMCMRTVSKHVALHLVPRLLQTTAKTTSWTKRWPAPPIGMAEHAAATPAAVMALSITLRSPAAQPSTRKRTHRAHVDEAAGLELRALPLAQFLAVDTDGAGGIHILREQQIGTAASVCSACLTDGLDPRFLQLTRWCR